MPLKLKADEGWWQDVPKLVERTCEIYTKLERDPVQVTAQKVVELRNWVVKEEELYAQIQALDFLYVPKKLFPGPLFLFPEFDTEGSIKRAQTKPLHTMFGPGKYYTIGAASADFLGPVWLGNDAATLDLIRKYRFVILVEGAFDLLAARVSAPHLPIMSPLTKNIGNAHQDYLRIAGAEAVYLMFDNDGGSQGQKSVDILSRMVTTMKVRGLTCPDHDPSDCLKTRVKKEALQRVLAGVE